MPASGTDDEFIRKHPMLAGLAFSAVLAPGVYFGTGAHKTGVPSLAQLALIVLLVAPITGFILKFFANRRGG